jgi:hypothetical protein
MRHGGGFRLVAVLLVIGMVAALTAGAYSAGFVAGAGTNATNVSPWVYGGVFGASTASPNRPSRGARGWG